ncbi:MAG: hypothetical protein JJ919_04980 [Henriciella sp.]|jgi:hypothetical protein|nr:hypothetical protein [Henriciella sp.]
MGKKENSQDSKDEIPKKGAAVAAMSEPVKKFDDFFRGADSGEPGKTN